MDQEIIALWHRKLGSRSTGSGFTPEIRLERRFTTPDFEGELVLQKTEPDIWQRMLVMLPLNRPAQCPGVLMRNVGIMVSSISLYSFLLPRVFLALGQNVDKFLLNGGWIFCLLVMLLYFGFYSLMRLIEYLMDKPNYFVGGFGFRGNGERRFSGFNATFPFGYLKINPDGIETGCQFLFRHKRFFAWDNLKLSQGKLGAVVMTRLEGRENVYFSSISKNELIYQKLKSYIIETK